MDIKYFLLIGLAIAIIAISPLSAADDDVSMLDALNITPFSEDTNVTIDGSHSMFQKVMGNKKISEKKITLFL